MFGVWQTHHLCTWCSSCWFLTVLVSFLHHILIRLLFLTSGSPLAIPVITDLSSWENKNTHLNTFLNKKKNILFSLLMLHSPWRFQCRRLYLDDGVGERVRDDVEQVGRVLPGLDIEGLDDEVGEFVQNPRGYFQGQKDQHRQPVKEVVDRSASEGPAGEGAHCWTCPRPCL